MGVERRRRSRSRSPIQRFKDLPIRHKVYIAGAAAIGSAMACCGGIEIVNHLASSSENQGEFDRTTLVEETEFTPAVPTPESTATPNPTPLQSEWDCVTINSPWPDADSYRTDLPRINNAYRAVKAAGDPEVVEESPYLYKDRYGDEHIINNLGQLDPYDGRKFVYNGEEVCVRISPNVISQLRQFKARHREEIAQEVKVNALAARNYELRVKRV